MNKLYELFHKDAVAVAKGAINVSTQIENALKSNIALDLFLLFPGGTELDKTLISVCEMAIKGGNALLAVADDAGLKGRMQRLASDLTHLQTANAHGISYCIQVVEAVFNDLFGKVENLDGK